MGRRVVVTGLGLICGVGNTTASVWQALLAGQSGVSRITAFDASAFACSPGICLVRLHADVIWQLEFTAGLIVRFR